MVLLVGDDEVLIEEATHWWYFGISNLTFIFEIILNVILKFKSKFLVR